MTSTAQETRTYRIEPARSTVEFTVSAMFGLHRVHGRYAVTRGAAVVGPRSVSVDAALDAASIDTGNARRDKDLRGARFLDVAAYPELTFRGEGVPVVGGSVTGSLGVRGSTAPVTLRIVEITATTVRATALVDRTDFVPGKRGLIGRSVAIALTIALVAGS